MSRRTNPDEIVLFRSAEQSRAESVRDVLRRYVGPVFTTSVGPTGSTLVRGSAQLLRLCALVRQASVKPGAMEEIETYLLGLIRRQDAAEAAKVEEAA